MLCRKRQGIAQAQTIGLIDLAQTLFALGLVGNQNDRLAGPPHSLRKMPVRGCDTGAGINDKQDRIRISNRRFCLQPHPASQRCRIGLFKACGVDDRKIEITQMGVPFATITCHARLVIDQGQFLTNQTVEQSRFANVGTANDGQSKGHPAPLFQDDDWTGPPRMRPR